MLGLRVFWWQCGFIHGRIKLLWKQNNVVRPSWGRNQQGRRPHPWVRIPIFSSFSFVRGRRQWTYFAMSKTQFSRLRRSGIHTPQQSALRWQPCTALGPGQRTADPVALDSSIKKYAPLVDIVFLGDDFLDHRRLGRDAGGA